MTVTVDPPAEPSTLMSPRTDITESSPRGLTGLVAELGRQHRANAQARHERRQQARDRRTGRRTATAEAQTGPGAWIRALPGRLQEGGVQIGYAMALAGSGVGQVSWWGAQFPLLIASSFALSFEAIMIGASRRARRLRRKGHSALGLRLIAWSAAAFGAGLNWFHLRDPHTVLTIWGQTIHGSPALGAAFAAFTALGFLTHEVSTSSDVRQELIANGYLRPLGLKRWLPPFTKRAWQARLLLIENPALSVEEAWAQAAPTESTPTNNENPPSESAAEHTTDDESSAETTTTTAAPTDTAAAPSPAEAAPVPAPTEPTHTSAPTATIPVQPPDLHRADPTPASDHTDDFSVDEVWLALLRPVAEQMFQDNDWLSINEVREVCTARAEGSKGVGKQRAGRLLRILTEECPTTPPPRQGGREHRERLYRAINHDTLVPA